MILHEHLSSCVDPLDLLFGRDKISCLTSSGVMGLKKRKNQFISIY